MNWSLLLFVIVLLSSVEISNCKIWEIPPSDPLGECNNRENDTLVDSSDVRPFSWLCEHNLNYTNDDKLTEYISDVMKYLEQLYTNGTRYSTSDSELFRKKRQDLTSSPCVRKEYRMLTLDERKRYHNAVNALKKDTTKKPNAYAQIANILGVSTARIAFGGPGFLGWNRIYLRVYENALKSKDPSVCLPYWDTTLDSQLSDPFLSSIWSSDFLGTPRGVVVDGPFANWRLPNGGQLIRIVGVDGDLLTSDIVNDILSKNSYDEIVYSDKTYLGTIENIIGLVHVYVGGTMMNVNLSAHDPVFFLLHAFVDYVFDQFRQRLRSRGVNPATYPRAGATGKHAPTAPTLIGSTTQADGYSEKFARGITYEPVPTCSAKSKTCGGRFLVCQVSSGKCIPTTRSKPKARRSVPETFSPVTTNMPTSITYDIPVQSNIHNVDFCDKSHWVTIPVKIVSVWTPRYGNNTNFTDTDGQRNAVENVYAPYNYDDMSKYINKCYGNIQTYPRCDNDSSLRNIFIYSYGMNYRGYYKESITVEQKEMEIVSLGFVAVRKPSTVAGGVSKVLIRAHDSCGRVCQVACRNPVTNEYQICSGAVAVSDEEPKMFSDTFDQAVLNVKIIDIHGEFENLNFIIYCDSE